MSRYPRFAITLDSNERQTNCSFSVMPRCASSRTSLAMAAQCSAVSRTIVVSAKPAFACCRLGTSCAQPTPAAQVRPPDGSRWIFLDRAVRQAAPGSWHHRSAAKRWPPIVRQSSRYPPPGTVCRGCCSTICLPGRPGTPRIYYGHMKTLWISCMYHESNLPCLCRRIHHLCVHYRFY